MDESVNDWWESVEATLAVGQQITGTPEELNQGLGHIVQLLKDASWLLEAVPMQAQSFGQSPRSKRQARFTSACTVSQPIHCLAERTHFSSTTKSTRLQQHQHLQWEAGYRRSSGSGECSNGLNLLEVAS